MYLLLKSVHVTSAVLSIGGFFFRGVLMLRGSPALRGRLLRTAPHVNDTVLLLAAIGLCVVTSQYPLANAWLTAKLTGLVCYVLLGLLALREGRSKGVRAASWVGALVAAGYVVSVAVSRDPWGFLLFLRGA